MSNTSVEILSQRGISNRGGGVLKVALDDATIAEVNALIARAPNGNVDPECDREWFASLLGKVLDHLESQYVRRCSAE